MWPKGGNSQGPHLDSNSQKPKRTERWKPAAFAVDCTRVEGDTDLGTQDSGSEIPDPRLKT
eukprot:152095-Karenia_brevis.AAC.1